MKQFFTLVLTFSFLSVYSQYTPETATRVRCGTPVTLPFADIPPVPGPDYSCLTNPQNSTWIFFTVCDSSTVELRPSTPAMTDTISVAVYGPFNDTISISAQLQSLSPVLCIPYVSSIPWVYLHNAKGIYYALINRRAGFSQSLYVNITTITAPNQDLLCNSYCTICNTFTSLNQEICTTDLDTTSQRNKFTWEKGDITNISGYIIYRENNISNQYDSLDFIPVSSLSEYIDMTANPATRPWGYKFAAVDVCGNQADVTQNYQRYRTLHLQQAMSTQNSINLSWNGNAGGNPSVPGLGGWIQTFYIYRGNSQSTMAILDSVPANTSAYTDLNPLPGVNYYQIEMRKTTPCVPSILPANAKSGSNFIATTFTGVTETNPFLRFSIQPNPATNILSIVLSKEAAAIANSITLYTVEGKKLQVITPVYDKQTISVSELPAGVYLMELKNDTGYSRKKFVIQ